MKSLTVAFVTAREKPLFKWFFDSLIPQINRGEDVRIIVIDRLSDSRSSSTKQYLEKFNIPFKWVEPKPTVWQGKHRVTKQDWWAASNGRNTAICLCETEWIAFLDDRCVLMTGWLDSIRSAMEGNYIIAGAYEKRHGMKVENGVITHGGIIQGEVHDRKRVIRGTDDREFYCKSNNLEMPATCGGEWLFGCNFALPLEWALTVNGQDETCDSSGLEDVVFGLQLSNNGYPFKYDYRMKMVEDRTPPELGQPMKREDKGVSPNDKSHALLSMLKDLKRANHPFDLRQIRSMVLDGHNFPEPNWPVRDFYDGQLISEM